ncbi:O-antigen ligase family protein [Bradyrhizobium sp. AUGA SZCCT0160]|uniref:O-antigen ligase family protein n=1 Tax=Bradyrhizobium sp. AUGA SZCCT0160 TaxID=2807662 RepID=UPI001BAD8470|nr:O-antigen ligase family protein [Bradyrhizobium sp. AUGA SZCCT0160]MBR1190070.1 O-antigen ligase family protein [Bradyrhizobium sp. AUGA SZCCT0160]
MVRFALVALAVSIYTAARSARPLHRRYVYAIFAMVIATSVAGTLTRYETWATLGKYIISNAHSSETVPWTPRSECGVIVNDSIGVRAVIWRDAVVAIPSAGLFGRGLNRFEDVSCFKGTSPHNIVLQALVEFGWIGGLSLGLLMISALGYAWKPAQDSHEARFVLCSLVFIGSISLIHGSMSHAGLLFLFLGYASRIYEDSFFDRQ